MKFYNAKYTLCIPHLWYVYRICPLPKKPLSRIVVNRIKNRKRGVLPQLTFYFLIVTHVNSSSLITSNTKKNSDLQKATDGSCSAQRK